LDETHNVDYFVRKHDISREQAKGETPAPQRVLVPNQLKALFNFLRRRVNARYTAKDRPKAVSRQH
jgi:hypothetical protein